MNGNDEHNWLSYLLFALISVWGGLINYFGRLRTEGFAFKWAEFVIDLAVSMFAGFIVGITAMALDVSTPMALAAAGLGGHAGSRTLFLFTRIAHKRLENWADKG